MKIIKIHRTLIALATGILTVIGNVIANLISGAFPTDKPLFIFIILIVAVFLGGGVYLFLYKEVITVRIKMPTTLRNETERKQNAKKGLVLIVSLYTPQKSSAANNLSIEDRWQAADQRDFRQLDFPNSNLAIAINAIKTHSSQLEHIWLLGTCSTRVNQPGSDRYIPAFVHYLRDEIGITCNIHFGETYGIPLEDDILVTEKTSNIINLAYKEANRYGIQDEELIVDLTSGTRAILMGIIMACLDGKRKIQFMGTHYGDDGKPVGDLVPIIFNYAFEINRQAAFE